jgi:hypothetical protein
MSWSKRNPVWAFGLRFCVLLALLLSPLPWLADTYTWVYGAISNGPLFVVDHDARYGFRFEPPATLRTQGSWLAVLRVDDRQTQETARMKLDVRAFSYRPIATYFALVLAARLKGRRRNIIVLGGGLAVMIAVTTVLTLAAAFRFGIGKVLGFGSDPLVETAYEAFTTPGMQYILPLLCFCVFVGLREIQSMLVRVVAASLALVAPGLPACGGSLGHELAPTLHEDAAEEEPEAEAEDAAPLDEASSDRRRRASDSGIDAAEVLAVKHREATSPIRSGTRFCETSRECFGLTCEFGSTPKRGACVARCATDDECDANERCLASNQFGASCFAVCTSPTQCAFGFECFDYRVVNSYTCLPGSWLLDVEGGTD